MYIDFAKLKSSPHLRGSRSWYRRTPEAEIDVQACIVLFRVLPCPQPMPMPFLHVLGFPRPQTGPRIPISSWKEGFGVQKPPVLLVLTRLENQKIPIFPVVPWRKKGSFWQKTPFPGRGNGGFWTPTPSFRGPVWGRRNPNACSKLADASRLENGSCSKPWKPCKNRGLVRAWPCRGFFQSNSADSWILIVFGTGALNPPKHDTFSREWGNRALVIVF